MALASRRTPQVRHAVPRNCRVERQRLKRVVSVSNVSFRPARRHHAHLAQPTALAGRGLAVSDVIAHSGTERPGRRRRHRLHSGSVDQPYTMSVQPDRSDPVQEHHHQNRRNGGFTKLGAGRAHDLGAEDCFDLRPLRRQRQRGRHGHLSCRPPAPPTGLAESWPYDALQKTFPPGVTYKVAFNSTTFVNESMGTWSSLLIAIFLVILGSTSSARRARPSSRPRPSGLVDRHVL